MNIYGEIQSLILQGYTNKEIQNKLLTVTYSQIIYQRRKIKKQAVEKW